MLLSVYVIVYCVFAYHLENTGKSQTNWESNRWPPAESVLLSNGMRPNHLTTGPPNFYIYSEEI